MHGEHLALFHGLDEVAVGELRLGAVRLVEEIEEDHHNSYNFV